MLLSAIVWLGGCWWHVEAAAYADNIYAQPPTTATLSGDQLDLLVAATSVSRVGYAPPSPARQRGNDDYLLDHGRVMHLYAIRWPEVDAALPPASGPGLAG